MFPIMLLIMIFLKLPVPITVFQFVGSVGWWPNEIIHDHLILNPSPSAFHAFFLPPRVKSIELLVSQSNNFDILIMFTNTDFDSVVFVRNIIRIGIKCETIIQTVCA